MDLLQAWVVRERRVADELQKAPDNSLSHSNKAVGSRHCAAVCRTGAPRTSCTGRTD
jgi:hypothetical protein